MGMQPGVIKADAVGRSSHANARPLHLKDLMAEVGTALAEARQEAARLVDEAKEEARVIRQAARDEGCRLGRDEGVKAGREVGEARAFEEASERFAQQQKSLIDACRQTIAGINQDRAEWKASAHQDLIELAMAIARRVTHQVGQRDRDVVLANLQEAVRLAGTRSDVTIAVNPADVEAAKLFAGTLMDAREQWEHVDVLVEPEVAPGGCRVQWGSGVVDARLDTQLDRIETELKGASPVGADPAGQEQA